MDLICPWGVRRNSGLHFLSDSEFAGRPEHSR
jgi:hypothetical protein